MDIEKIKQNKLKMILGFSIPSIIAMLLETVITMTDGYFTGNYVSESALAAINLGLPILYLYLGLGLCVGVGGSVICGRLIGAKDKKKASETLSQTVVTSIVFCVAVSVIVFALFGPIQGFLKAEGELAGYFKDYYMVMLFNYPVMVVATVLGMFIRMDGRPGICMAISIAGCILNVILDYIFVAALGMGVFGSAVGSLIVQLVTAVTMAAYFLRRCAGIHFTGYKFDKNLHKDMIFNGSSEFIGEMASAISMYAFNYVLIKYAGAEGVAAYTIMGYVVYAFSMICIGFGQGITPLISVCFGAKEYETAAHLRKITNVILFDRGCFDSLYRLDGKAYCGTVRMLGICTEYGTDRLQDLLGDTACHGLRRGQLHVLHKLRRRKVIGTDIHAERYRTPAGIYAAPAAYIRSKRHMAGSAVHGSHNGIGINVSHQPTAAPY